MIANPSALLLISVLCVFASFTAAFVRLRATRRGDIVQVRATSIVTSAIGLLIVVVLAMNLTNSTFRLIFIALSVVQGGIVAFEIVRTYQASRITS